MNHLRLGLLFSLFSLFALGNRVTSKVSVDAFAQNSVATVSAANYGATLAPDSIAAAFGVNLATRVEQAVSIPLPTLLAGTTVRVNDRLTQLFFVSPGQINFLIPPEMPVGEASVIVTATDGTVSRGTVRVTRVAPALFTANGTGAGVPAAQVLRVKADGSFSYEAVARADASGQIQIPKPIEFGAADEPLYLVLFGTGLRGRENLSDVAIRIGGVNAKVEYAGAQGLVGLDQVNALLPRELLGRGRVNLTLGVNGFGAANTVELEIAGARNVAPPRITEYSTLSALAGESLAVRGTGFSQTAAENTVRIGGVEARVESASASELRVRVPFGALSGPISVLTAQGEGQGEQVLQLRTSVSGIVEDTRRQPLAGVTVRALGRNILAVTNNEGAFLLPDLPAALAQDLEFDGGTVAGSLPYPKVRLKKRVIANRDNQMDGPIALQQINGPGVPTSSSLAAGVGACSPAFRRNDLLAQNLPSEGRTTCMQLPAQVLRVGNVAFEIPAGAGVSLPDGATSGMLNLTLVENSRPPVKLPPGLFSATVPQLTPFSAVILPGGKLTLPNDERYPAGTQVKLLRFDQTRTSPTLGQFVEAGVATVSADGQRIETAPNAITEITQYFVASPRQTTTVVGRVVDSNGVTPVRQALVRCRGQEAFTDGNGGFAITDVVVNAGDSLSVEASFLRANGRVDRTQRTGFTAVVNGLTTVTPDLILPADNSNRAPVLLAPTALRINEAETREVSFVAFDPDPGQTIQLALTGAAFVTLINRGNDVYTLRMQPRANDAGRYNLALVAVDNLGQASALNLSLNVNRPPVANAQSVITDEDTPRTFTLTASDPDGDPLNYEIVSNPRNGRLTGVLPNLTYTPNPRYTGSDSITFRVNDGLADSAPASVSFAINPVNHRPVLTVPAAQTINEGQELGFTVTASDIDAGQTLAFTASNLPGGANFTPTSGTTARFVWTPNFAQAGAYTVSFRVTDNGVPAQSDTKIVTIMVNDVNRPPVLNVPAAQNVVAGQNISFTVSATDPDLGQTVALSLEDLPPGATFNSASGLFTWTPNAPRAGAYELIFKASDNGSPARSGTATVALAVTIQWKKTANIDGGFVNSLYGDGRYLYAGGRGIFRSDSNGRNWLDIDTREPLSNWTVKDFLKVGPKLYVAGDAGVSVSSDDGHTWAEVNSGLQSINARTLAFKGQHVFVGTFDGVYRSANQGQMWLPFRDGLPLNPRVSKLLVDGNNLIVTTEQNGVFLSINEGQNWVAMNDGLPSNIFISSIVKIGGNLFAGGNQGVFLYSTEMRKWMPVSSGLPSTFVSALVANGDTIFATTFAGLFRSVNQGQSWQVIREGLPVGGWNTAFAGGLNLVIGSDINGIFISSDNGLSWVNITNGYSSASIRTLRVDGQHLFVGADIR